MAPRILPDVSQIATLQAQVIALQAALAEKSRPASFTLKVSVADATKGTKGGAVCAYGIGRFPVALYAQQWERLLSHKDEILAFIKAHPELPRK